MTDEKDDVVVPEKVTTLNDILEDKGPAESDKKDEADTDVKGDESDDESDDKPDKSKDKPDAANQKDESVPKKALLDERRKRQELEDKLKELQAKQVKIPDPVEDPEGYAAYLDDTQQRNLLKARTSMSREIMIGIKTDYEETEKVFIQLCSETDSGGNPTPQAEILKRNMLASANPAKFAYDHAKEHLRIKELSDPQYKEKLRAQILEDLAKDGSIKPAKKSVAEVPDLTSATAAGVNGTKTIKPKTLDDILPG